MMKALPFGIAPAMFGSMHILFLLFLFPAAYCTGRKISRFSFPDFCRTLFCAGILLACMECWKQIHVYTVTEGGRFSWWWFPFQLCSMPMYLCLMLPLVKRKNTVFAFLSTYAWIAAVCALFYPQDMLRSDMALTLHGFLWHGIMLAVSFSVILFPLFSMTRKDFLYATCLFLFLCGIAVILNIYGYYQTPTGGIYPNLFYISPLLPSRQPVFSLIAEHWGIIPGHVVYILSLILASSLTAVLQKRCLKSSQASSDPD